MAKKPAPARTRRTKKKGFWYYVRMLLNYIAVGIYYVFKWIFLGLRYIAVAIWSAVMRVVSYYKTQRPGYGKLRSSEARIAQFRIVETVRGADKGFWNKLRTSDSLIGIILGARGSGKSAVALALAENLHHAALKRKMFAMGFNNAELPTWIKEVQSAKDLENDSFVIIDEGGLLFSSRDSMSGANRVLSDLLLIARHKSLSIIFISQNSSNLEINTLRQADFLILKKSSLLQKEFERKIIADIYEKYQDGFERHKGIKGLALVYSDQFLGFVENELPSFWSQRISKSFK